MPHENQELKGNEGHLLIFVVVCCFVGYIAMTPKEKEPEIIPSKYYENTSSTYNYKSSVSPAVSPDAAKILQAGAMEGDIDRIKAYVTQVKKKDLSEALRALGARNLLLGSQNMDDYLECAKILVNAGAEINARNTSQETALHSAASMGLSSVVKFLVKKGAKLRVRDVKGYSPLDNAYYSKDIVGDREGANGVFRDYSGTIRFLESVGAPKYK